MSVGAPCRFLPWDSEFFGMRIGHVEGNRLTEPLIERIERWAESERIDCLYFLGDLSDAVTLRLAEGRQFLLTDVRVTLDRKPSVSRPASAKAEATFRVALPEDTEPFKAIARVSYSDTRFFFDGRFATERCVALYETWIDESLKGFADCVLTAEMARRAVGYITCHVDGRDSGRIGLVGVAGEARGLGVASGLVEAALNWFEERGITRVSVVTQGRNVAAQRLYQRCGFRTALVQLWYHRWFSGGRSAGT